MKAAGTCDRGLASLPDAGLRPAHRWLRDLRVSVAPCWDRHC